MKNWAIKSKTLFKDKNFIFSFILSLALLLGVFVVNYYAGTYATERASNSVTDIVLSNTRAYDVDAIFIYGPLIFWAFVAIFLFLEPKRIPFTFKTIALFVVIRSIFISLTHLGPFPVHAVIENGKIFEKISFGADLFFSGHTGLPFLMALVFWYDKYLRWIFTGTAIFFGVIVLLGHLHYSIDVLSAFFITYAIFHMAELFFRKDRKMFFS